MSTKSLGTLSLDLLVQTGGFEAGMDKATRTADRKTRQMEREAKARAQAIEASFTKMAAGITAAWGALNLVGSIRGAADLADELSKMSQRTGVAVKDLSALNYAASLNDASMQDLGNGLKGLSNKMLAAQSGSAEAAAAFAALGVKVTDSAGKLRPAEAVMLDIAEAFSKMQDGAGKSALANKLMEESGIRLIPTLNNGRAGLEGMRQEAEQLSRTMQDLAPFSVEFNDNLTRLNTQGQTLAATLSLATVPALNEVAKEILQASKDAGTFDVAAAAARVTVETLAVTGANVAFVFSGVGREIGGVAAQLAALSTLDFKAFSAIGDAMRADAEEARARLDAFEQRVFNPKAAPTAAPGTNAAPTLPTTKTPTTTSTKGKASIKPYDDPMADAAKAYGAAIEFLTRAQQQADTSGLKLTATQQKLMEVMSAPGFAQMPEAWRRAVASQAEYTLQAEKAAAEQQRLNELIAATPTAQLEQQRETMQFLAQAFEQGRISAEQFKESATTALGNTPAAVKDTSEAFLDMALVANDAANAMAGAFAGFFTGQQDGIKDMLASFLKATAQMIAQAAILKALKSSALFGGLFADGAAFDGGVRKFATGGTFTNAVVNSPTLFKFANGGNFQTGVMGEAGPEAVMPLKRGADGKLGVVAGGGSGTTITQSFNVTVQGGGSDSAAQAAAINKELAKKMRAEMMAILNEQKRYGGMLA